MAKIEWMPAIDIFTGRRLEVTYSDENLLIEIWSYYENPDRLYFFHITENIAYSGRNIVARYSLDNIKNEGSFYSLESCQNFIEKLVNDCEYKNSEWKDYPTSPGYYWLNFNNHISIKEYSSTEIDAIISLGNPRGYKYSGPLNPPK